MILGMTCLLKSQKMDMHLISEYKRLKRNKIREIVYFEYPQPWKSVQNWHF
jgi:hypothetical protein